MTTGPETNWLRAALVAAAVLSADSALVRPARADADADAKIGRLLDLLVRKNIVSQRQAHELLRETEGTPKASRRARAAPEEASPPPTQPGDIRVSYVPQFVRKQIADEVRAQVLTEEKDEGWAVPGVIPEWTRRFTLYGDLRVRYERDSFDQRNYNQFVNFQGINQGSAFDIESYAAGTAAPPSFLNTTQDRDRARVRARLGVEADVDTWLKADFRVSTGDTQGPVSPNQTMGQPGDFAKYAAYIDRAYLSGTPAPGLTLLAGRFYNPFDTTDLIFYNELNFDGLAAKYHAKLSPTTSATLVGGVFPILNTAFDFSTDSSTKYGSSNAYMLAVQGRGEWQARPDVLAKLGAGFFDFNGVQGAVSRPCFPQQNNFYACSTDASRFPFQQFGNTVYAIRDIVPITTTGTSTEPNPQYFGLASRFAVLEVRPRVEVTTYHPFDLVLDGEFIKNLDYDRAAILRHGPTNGPIGPQNNIGSNGLYQGGDTGYIIRGQIGAQEIHKLWDWNLMAAYKYIETDATLDSINDADFHLGGTNAKGYILTGTLGIAKDTFVSLRYFSSTVISGPPDGNQVFQVDVLSTF